MKAGKHTLLKKFSTFALAASLSVGILATFAQPTEAATNYQVAKVTYSKDYKLEDGTTYFTVKGKFPQIKEDSEVSKKINQALTKEKNRIIRQWKKNAKSYKSEAEGSKEEELTIMQYGDEIKYNVYSNDENYFSVMLSGYVFLGGAHGMPYRSCLTFDAQTGEKLTAAKVFGISKKQLNQKVKKLYLNKYDKKGEEAGFYPGIGAKDGRKQLENNLKNMDFNNYFYVKNGKAVFYAEPYAVGPYAAGFISVSATIQ